MPKASHMKSEVIKQHDVVNFLFSSLWLGHIRYIFNKKNSEKKIEIMKLLMKEVLWHFTTFIRFFMKGTQKYINMHTSFLVFIYFNFSSIHAVCWTVASRYTDGIKSWWLILDIILHSFYKWDFVKIFRKFHKCSIREIDRGILMETFVIEKWKFSSINLGIILLWRPVGGGMELCDTQLDDNFVTMDRCGFQNS